MYSVLNQCLGIIRSSLRASFTLLLKVSIMPTGIKSTLLSYSASPGAVNTLYIGADMFNELSSMTLNRENCSSPFVLDQLNSGPVTKDVDVHLNKKILRCASEVIWSHRTPCAILATFYEGIYHFVAEQELNFIREISATLSTLFEKIDLSDSFLQASAMSKQISVAIKKNPLPFGNTVGLAPTLLILEPILPLIKGFNHESFSKESLSDMKIQAAPAGAKGQAEALALAEKNDIESVMGKSSNDPNIIVQQITATESQNISAQESADLMRDFTTLTEVLAERCNLSKPKKCGHLVIMI